MTDIETRRERPVRQRSGGPGTARPLADVPRARTPHHDAPHDDAPSADAPHGGPAPGGAAHADAAELRALPPLVFAGECDLLRERLARVARGEAFVLQGGLHAKTYGRETADAIRDTLRTMMQMSALLTYATSVPVVKVSRIAHFTDPRRLVARYQTAAAALNLVRAFASGGYAGLRQVHAWNREFVAASPSRAGYEPLSAQLGRALDFMDACGPGSAGPADVEFFASHEARQPVYEKELTRIDSRAGEPYSTASHFVWIGERTGELDGAFVDHLARIRNPIGIALGPGCGPDEASAHLDRFDPEREPGRLTFVVRMGADAVRDTLPAVIEKVTAQGHRAAWICDAMHPGVPLGADGGPPGPRTFDDVLDEVTAFFEVHRALGTHPGGLHVELTGREIGGPEDRGLQRHPAPDRVMSLPPTPCLTRAGALDLAFLVAQAYRDGCR
ncbi:3-deoxy-7-phosphoheptulonate synthase [Streptomyces sp. DSM 42041]|uniref:Phospho-2-dehydro-3-deoxyheptonate aldolase n=1 Tax=Streptomyces hazeniae TaxID=3075538 RepID=A0ABU2NLM9_9ACTN|nr:3-deoxy-7-phosphoheptulonate synthase [Streptomyces sp. DSM 42041]MDT0377665.1 3-deoxy-7-phosphoheptulonate synthase [Streptomyces sp. DSM 42041]